MGDEDSDFEHLPTPPPVRKRAKTLEEPADEESESTESEKENSQGGEVEEGCPICMERWTSSGSHRIAALRCGHLFGRSCINRWLSAAVGKTRCPQCNAPAKLADIRLLYVPRGLIRVLETDQLEELKRQLEEERKLKREAQMAEANARLRRTMVEAEMERLKAEMERLRQRILPAAAAAASTLPVFKYWRSYGLVPPTGGLSCRGMVYDQVWGHLVVSRQQADGQGGLVKLNCALPDAPFDSLPSLHTRPIKGMALSPQADGLLLTGSLDATIRLTTLASHSQVLSLSAPAPVWSVRWLDRHTLVAGLANASLQAWDLRQPGQELWQAGLGEHFGGPIHSLLLEQQPEGRLLVGNSQGILALDQERKATWLHRVEEGGITSLSSNGAGIYTMTHRRPAPLVAQTTVVCPGEQQTNTFTIDLPSPATLMTRAQAMPLTTEPGCLLISPDEASSSLLLHHYLGQREEGIYDRCSLQATLPTNTGMPIVDCLLAAADEQNPPLLAALTERTVCLWRQGNWQDPSVKTIL